MANAAIKRLNSEGLLPTVHVNPEAVRDCEYSVLQKQIRENFNMVPAFDTIVGYDCTGTDAEFLTGEGFTMIEEAITKIVIGQMDISEWDRVIDTYRSIEGDTYSAVWTQQYHEFAGD